MIFDRITVNPQQMMGAPCIRGMRMPVTTILHMIAGGMSFDEILHFYPLLEREDIEQALQYAAEVLSHHEIVIANNE